MTIEAILNRKGAKVATIKGEATMSEAARILAEANIGALVVSPDGSTVQGILSERDIVKSLGQSGVSILEEPVSKHMTANVVTCQKSDRAVSIMGRMTQRRIRHLPVVDDGAMIGIVSIGDIVKTRIDELQGEAEAMRDMLHTY
ncbi:MAG: CBS domain-containing protein [Pseudomonadota bacterium]